MAADERGDDAPDLGSTVLIRGTAGAATEDGRAHYLAVVAGERAGLRVELGDKPVVIGRVPPADMVIDDSQISRKHCRVSLVMEEVYVADLGSSNGTMVDFTVFMAIACATASFTPSTVKGNSVCILRHGYLSRAR